LWEETAYRTSWLKFLELKNFFPDFIDLNIKVLISQGFVSYMIKGAFSRVFFALFILNWFFLKQRTISEQYKPFFPKISNYRTVVEKIALPGTLELYPLD